MICQLCGIEAPTKKVKFYQNIGALVVRFPKEIDGHLCKKCIHQTFWKFTGTTAVLGWWGTISLIMAPCFIINNVARYLTCLSMAPVPVGASQPVLTDEVVQRLQPLTSEMIDRLNSGEDFERVMEHIGTKARATKGQAALYCHALLQAAQQQEPTA